MNESINKTCCGFFIDTLHRVTNSKNIVKFKSTIKTSDNELAEQEYVINDDLDQSDLDNFLSYCNLWQQKQCFCIYPKDDLIEKFHHFLHQIMSLSIITIKNLSNPTSEGAESDLKVLKKSPDFIEKLLCSLVKIFSLNMPLYLAYKLLLNNNPGRYSRSVDCSCCNLSQDSLNLIQIYCITNQDSSPANKHSNQDLDNLPIEFLRNICQFIDLYGLVSIKQCFIQSHQYSKLPLNLVHLLFNIIVNIRVWLNPTFVEQQILPIRPLAINYMCSLCDKDLRLAGTRNTIEFMYESFKLPSLNSYINQASESSQNSSPSDQTSQDNCTFEFKIDLDGLKLAHKYLTSTTLTIRLSGVAQMSLQINAWSEFNSLNTINLRNKTENNELADWFVQNNIIEYLYGPNLHHEIIKRSQDIVNFLAFTKRLTEKHLDVIWASAQLKYCSKPVMETLISLIKHLDINSDRYLSKLVSKLDFEKQTDQTLFLSALLTKNQWSLMIEFSNPKKILNQCESEVSQSSTNLCFKKKIRTITSSSDEEDDKIKNKRLRQRRQTVNSFVNSVDENEESEDEDYEESEEEEESENSEHKSEDTDDLDMEVERVNSGHKQRNYDSSQDGLNEELTRINRINEKIRLRKENGNKYLDQELESHSSNVSTASSVKKFGDVDEDSDDEITTGEETDSAQIFNNCLANNQLTMNSYVDGSRLSNVLSNEEETNTSESNRLNLNELCEPGNTFLWDLLMNQTDHIRESYPKIIKEAEKQFQIIICLPTTDRRIKFKFIESCIKKIHKPDTCPIALRLLTKIFSSFQQFNANTFNFLSEFKNAKKLQPTKPITDMYKSLFFSKNLGHQHPANEIHKIVALTDFKFNLINEFFISLKNLEQTNDQHMQIQVRLQFLSFIYSTIGSLVVFDLCAENVNDLWACLAKFEKNSQIKDDIFNWFLNQAKNKDQHAISVDNFKFIFEQKMTLLEPNSFSLSALHLYQELFKIYKSTSEENEEIKQKEQSAIDHILKLAFKSKLNDVSLSAIHFLNSHHANNEGEFIEKCLEYLRESRTSLEDGDSIETSLIEIQRGLLLLKNHLDLNQRKNSYRIRLIQIKEPKYLNHSKCLIDYDNCDLLVRFLCHVNSTRFSFELVMMPNDCVGDLKAIVREILLNCIKTGKELNNDENGHHIDQNDSPKLVFNPNNLKNFDMCKKAYSNLIQGNQNSEMFKLILTLVEKEDALYIKLFTNNQELTTESKLLSELGFKDYQTINVSLFSKSVLNQSNSVMTHLEPQTLPIVILSREENFNSLFKLLNLLARMSGGQFELIIKKKICHLSNKCWKIINTLPSNGQLLGIIKDSGDLSLSDLYQDLQKNEPINLNKSIGFDKPYQLLYYIQLIEITFSNTDSGLHKDKKSVTCTKYIYKIGHLLTNYLWAKNQPKTSMLKFDVRLECLNILLKLFNRCLLDSTTESNQCNFQNPKKKLKKNSDNFSYSPCQLRVELFSSIFHPDNMIKIFIPFVLNVQCLSTKSQSESCLSILNQSMKLLVDSLSNKTLTTKLKNELIDGSMNQHRLNWLKALLMCSKSETYRQDAATWIHRLCFVDEQIFSCLVNQLFELIETSAQYKPSVDEIACKEYFELITGLLSNKTRMINFGQLMQFVGASLESRDTYEILSLNSSTFLEDNFMVGILGLASGILKNQLIDQNFDDSLVEKLIGYLFATSDYMRPRVVLPKLRSERSRQLGFDVLLELCKFRQQNYIIVVNRLIRLHETGSMVLWDYWPRNDVRSIYGYLGLINLGATCYMATSLQHLFMIKEARRLILESKTSQTNAGQYDNILLEVKKIFAFLQESEREAYSPKDLCKVYTMDQQVLNTGEQKDMQEFFTDLISKLEETSDPNLKNEIKKLFGGVITNVVISLDCPHVSSSLEEFYTVRCQVAGMKDLYESLNEITVKDTLEGDNMYTCSTCSKKVRAEKRACFKQLPEVLCLNTMRYTFNMVTMLKEKVNTYFSFPLELNMSGYMEQNLIETDTKNVRESNEEFVYDLIGVTVHTGTADGGHYYSFIQEIDEVDGDSPKWFLFNDAEVKQFDVDSQLAAECFGGETTSKSYDSHNDKFNDLAYEKTNSAYMLFYKKRSTFTKSHTITSKCNDQILLNEIWSDNIKLITDRLIFEKCYFNFVFEVCDLALKSPQLTLPGAQLALTFFLETFIHSREKHQLIQWIDMLNKLSACEQICRWLLDRLIRQSDWLCKILIKCPQVSISNTFQKFLLTIVNKCDTNLVHKFLSVYISLLEERHSIRYMCDYFEFLAEFCLMGEQQASCLLELNLIRQLCSFYMRNRRRNGTDEKAHATDSDNSDFSIDNLDSDTSDSENDIITLNDQRSKPKVFEKILLILVQLTHSYLVYIHKYYQLKQFNRQITNVNIPLKFFYKTILDGLNLTFVKHLFQNTICLRANLQSQFKQVNYVQKFLNMCCRSIGLLAKKNAEPDKFMNFFNAISFLLKIEFERVCADDIECALCEQHSMSDDYSQLVIEKLSDLLDLAPYFTLRWLAELRHTRLQLWLLDNMDVWLKRLLIDAKQTQVRFSAAVLIVNLVPDVDFRQEFTSNRNMLIPYRAESSQLTEPFKQTINKIIRHLFSIMSSNFLADCVDTGELFQSTNLIQYFTLIIYFLIGSEQKRLCIENNALEIFWQQVYFKHMANNHVTTNLNKQLMSHFVYHCLNECSPVLDYLTECNDEDNFVHNMAKEMPMCTVVIDHEDADLINYNKQCLHPFYASIRLLCEHSSVYKRYMYNHSNLQWALKHVLPYSTLYPLACAELVKLVDLMSRENGELNKTLCTQLLAVSAVDIKLSFQSIVWVLKTVIRSSDDTNFVLTKSGLSTLSNCFIQLVIMFNNNQDTQCPDINDCLVLIKRLVINVREHLQDKTDGVEQLLADWKEKFELIKRLIVMLNFWVPSSTRLLLIDLIRLIIEVNPVELAANTIAILKQSYSNLNYYQTCNLFPKGSIMSKKATINSLNKCVLSNQSVNHATGLMGVHFPVATSSPPINVRKLKSTFNLYLPLTLVNHCHYDGSISMLSRIVGHLNEYEKSLRDSFLPLFNFYHFLFKFVFTKWSVLNEQHTKNLIDLLLIVSAQAMYFNVHFICYLNDKVDECTELIAQSNHLSHFIQLLLTDYRHLLSRDEYDRFMCEHMSRFVRSFLPRNQTKSDNFSHLLSQTIKNIIRLALSTINEVRFFFEFSPEKLNDECTLNLELKRSSILGSIRCVQLIVRSVSQCQVDKQFVKFVKQLKDFFASYWEDMIKQSEEMSKYLDDEGHRSKKVKLDEAEGADLRARLESKLKCTGAVLQALKHIIDMMNGLIQGLEAMDDESTDDTTDETSSSSTSSQEASTESGSNNEQESMSEQEQINA